MKTFYSLLILLLFITTSSIAQGISVQGIARDNASSAILDEILTFTFSITEDDNTVLYAEEQSIRTDNFGVFSHIVSTGNPQGGTVFNDIDFEIENLKLKVFVHYNNVDITVYDQTLQYTPYAHFAKNAKNAQTADNGVPPGAIMPYLGTTAPTGWVFCKGQSITSVAGSAALMAIVGNYAPNLQGMFLRGAGSNGYSSQVTTLKGVQDDAYRQHLHGKGSLYTGSTSLGNIPYSSSNWVAGSIITGNSGGYGPYKVVVTGDSRGNTTGSHSHTVYGSTANAGSVLETRPVNYGVNYIIKL
jgi:hypothetical protein